MRDFFTDEPLDDVAAFLDCTDAQHRDADYMFQITLNDALLEFEPQSVEWRELARMRATMGIDQVVWFCPFCASWWLASA